MGRKWGDRKSAHFFKNRKNGESQKKKKGAKWGDNKTRPFLKNGVAQNKKNGRTPGWREKIQIFSFQKKKKMGRKWAQGENPPFSKNGRQKKKNGGGAHRFFDKKKSPIFLISLFIASESNLTPKSQNNGSKYEWEISAF